MGQLNTRIWWSAATLCVLVACGGGSSGGPGTPTNPNPPPPPAPTNTWSIAGSVLDTVGRQPIGGATVTPSWSLPAVTANGSGDYSLGAVANPPFTPYKLTVSADGFLTREQYVRWQAGARTGVTFDLIRNAAPFSMDFYKQLVRGTNHDGAPWPVLRLTQEPKFYFKTIDQRGVPLEPEVVSFIRNAIARAVPLYTGNLYGAQIETGTETRPDTPGWINVLVRYDLSERSTCGSAFVGRDPGEITFVINDVCSCGSTKVPGHVVLHEVGHALGFFHVTDRSSVMFAFIPGSCPAGDPSAAERYHAAIAYQRPRGNADPDNDPTQGQLIGAGDAIGPQVRIRN